MVIPVLGGHDVLSRVLDGFAAQDVPGEAFEVLVVADRAEEELVELERAVGQRPYATKILRGEQPGPSSSRNIGWQAARAPLVLFTDSDTIPVARLVSEHLAWQSSEAAAGTVVVGPVRWARELGVTPFMRWLERGIQFDFQSIRGTEASWAHVYTANCSVRRDFLERVGGYDAENLPYGYEDLDWGYRARQHGLRALFNRRATVIHYRKMTVEQWEARAPRLAQSEWRFCQLHPEVSPFFYDLFAEVACLPLGGGRSAALTRFVPPGAPLIGPAVWSRAGFYWRRRIAPHFLAAWKEAEAGRESARTPAAAARAERRSAPSG